MAIKKNVKKPSNPSGRPSLYDEKKHIPLLYEVYNNMEGVFAFCDEALITRQTFCNWLKAHPEFKENHKKALCKGARKWERLPLENPNISHPYWMTIMKNRFGYYKTKIDVEPNATPNEKITAVWESVQEGELSAQEATQLASLVETQAKVESNNIDGTNPFKVQSIEDIEKRKEAIMQLIEADKILKGIKK